MAHWVNSMGRNPQWWGKIARSGGIGTMADAWTTTLRETYKKRGGDLRATLYLEDGSEVRVTVIGTCGRKGRDLRTRVGGRFGQPITRGGQYNGHTITKIEVAA